jgi:hypothetical protein
MSKVPFSEALDDADILILSPGCKTEICGYFTNFRVDRSSVPEGWYAYDIRHGDSGELCTIEKCVLVNHAGTFLTKTPVKLNKDGFRSLIGRGGYTFA